MRTGTHGFTVVSAVGVAVAIADAIVQRDDRRGRDDKDVFLCWGGAHDPNVAALARTERAAERKSIGIAFSVSEYEPKRVAHRYPFDKPDAFTVGVAFAIAELFAVGRPVVEPDALADDVAFPISECVAINKSL